MLRDLHQTLPVEGVSGETYNLHQFSFDDFDEIKEAFPNCGGIYVSTYAELGQEHYSVYCGKTDDLSTRFNNHHKETCIRRNRANRISLMRVDSETVRNRIEVDIHETTISLVTLNTTAKVKSHG